MLVDELGQLAKEILESSIEWSDLGSGEESLLADDGRDNDCLNGGGMGLLAE